MPTKLPEEICVALNILKSLNQAVGTVKCHREERTGDGEMEMMEDVLCREETGDVMLVKGVR